MSAVCWFYTREASSPTTQRWHCSKPVFVSRTPSVVQDPLSRCWFQTFFIFTPIWGRFPFWLIFFKGVETANQIIVLGEVLDPKRLGGPQWWWHPGLGAPLRSQVLARRQSRRVLVSPSKFWFGRFRRQTHSIDVPGGTVEFIFACVGTSKVILLRVTRNP